MDQCRGHVDEVLERCPVQHALYHLIVQLTPKNALGVGEEMENGSNIKSNLIYFKDIIKNNLKNILRL
jgi:hypothetical protein